MGDRLMRSIEDSVMASGVIVADAQMSTRIRFDDEMDILKRLSKNSHFPISGDDMTSSTVFVQSFSISLFWRED
ncbi:hypothetical protein KIN20_034054 [Parelaphostrongylus tenuis]|uniref:Uncharacterized protein n=1 Tax=Parelaphostrongylus tenuis TaxID=148309 RepID=A0AAD5RBP1_PARTN|nr:hypothetical protein KIN20_034054 [Parelaphostrongylus tenuis]